MAKKTRVNKKKIGPKTRRMNRKRNNTMRGGDDRTVGSAVQGITNKDKSPASQENSGGLFSWFSWPKPAATTPPATTPPAPSKPWSFWPF